MQRAVPADLELELLIVRCQLGDVAAFDALIERWHLPLWKYARRVTGSDDAAAEMVQEVWLRVVRGLTRLREAGRFRPWLFGIARRVLMDRLRERYAQPVIVPVEDVDLRAADAELEDAIDLDRLHADLSKLPVVEREALVLFYLDELSLAEMAEVLQVPVGTVKSRLHRARGLLRQRLEAQGITS